MKITTHAFVKGKGGDFCEHRAKGFVCAQPKAVHKKPKGEKK